MTDNPGAYVAGDIRSGSAPPPVPLRNNPKFRALVYQLVLLALVLWFGYEFALNAKANLQAQQITNLPLLFQILFWYLAVLGTLPGPRQSISLWGGIFLNNRGLSLPAPVAGKGAG